ncbi:hypothetical protein BJ165DRAFT_1008558 [Panaeolus papilionaceus]|nr:hypothetical protein BJ165DRAFT_1008558 [Panaeolus papilionaceus]
MSFQPWSFAGNGGLLQPPLGLPQKTPLNAGIVPPLTFDAPGAISASSSMMSTKSDAMFGYTSNISSTTTLGPETGNVQIQPSTQEIASFLAQAPWMRFSIVAQPDFSSISKDPRFRDFVGRVSSYTLQSVNQQIHQELIQSVNQVVANLSASVDQRVAAVQWAILNELATVDAECYATPQDWLNPTVLDSFLAGLNASKGVPATYTGGDSTTTGVAGTGIPTDNVVNENDSLDCNDGDNQPAPEPSDADQLNPPLTATDDAPLPTEGDESQLDPDPMTTGDVPSVGGDPPTIPEAVNPDADALEPDDDSQSNAGDDTQPISDEDRSSIPVESDDPIPVSDPAPDEAVSQPPTEGGDDQPTVTDEDNTALNQNEEVPLPDTTAPDGDVSVKQEAEDAPPVEVADDSTSTPAQGDSAPLTNPGSSADVDAKPEAFLSSPVPLAGSSWIWTQEADENPRPNPPHARAFRHTITTDRPVNTLTIDIAGERRYTLYVNGRLVGMGDTWDVPDRYTVRFDNTTKVVLAAYVAQSEYRANVGLVASGQIWDAWETPSPVGIVFRTSEEWKTLSSDTISGEFIQPDFDDSAWERSFSQAMFAEGPWRTKSTAINNGGRPHEYVQGITSVPDAFDAPLAELLKPPPQ